MDEALRFYTQVLGLEKRADVPGRSIRWLTVAPKGQQFPGIVLAQAGKNMLERVGQGTTWVFDTGDCRKMYEILREGSEVQPPEESPWPIATATPYSLMQPSPNRT